MPYAEFCHKLCTLPLSQRFSPISCLKMPQGQAHEASLRLGAIPQRWCKWAQHNQLHSRPWPDEIAGQSVLGSLLPGRHLERFMAESLCQNILGIVTFCWITLGLCSGNLTGGRWRNEEQTHRHTDTPSQKLRPDTQTHPQKNCDQMDQTCYAAEARNFGIFIMHSTRRGAS